jgi:hypothetical protein
MGLLAGGSIGEAGYGPQVDTVVGRKAVGGRLSGLKPLDGLLQVESRRRKVEGGLLVAAQAGRGTDGLGVATVAMWPPVPRRKADEGGRGAATRGRP